MNQKEYLSFNQEILKHQGKFLNVPEPKVRPTLKWEHPAAPSRSADVSSYQQWIRPSDWINIYNPSDNTINLLIGDYGIGGIAFRITTLDSSTYRVNWGDASNNHDVSSGAIAYHQYTPGDGSTCSLGYTTFKCSITSDASILSFIIERPYDVSSYYNYPAILQAVFNTPNLTNLSGAFSNGGAYARDLEELILPSTLDQVSNISNMCNVAGGPYSITMPSSMLSLISISSAFNGCSRLQYFTFPTCPSLSSLTTAFSGCTSLKRINNFPTSLPTVSSLASTFQNCRLLEEINLPSSMPELTNLSNTFYYCYNLKSLNLPVCPSVNNISYAFNYCTNLTHLDLPSWPELIYADYAFDNCINLESVDFSTNNFPKLTNVSAMFRDCQILTGTLDFTNCPSISTMSYTFQNCQNLIEVKLPLEMPQLVDLTYAFFGMRSLRKVVLPNKLSNLTQLYSTFQSSPNIESITLPVSAPKITNAYGAFNGCNNLASIDFPKDASAITDMGFFAASCFKLKSVSLPSSLPALTTLQYAFQNCYSLESLDLSINMNLLNTLISTFNGCYSLKNLSLPGSLPNLSMVNSTFQNCFSLQEINIPSNSTSISNLGSAFSACRSLKSVKLPSTLNSLTTLASTFNGCYSLKSVELPTSMNALTTINQGFVDCRELEYINLPVNLPALTNLNTAFSNCKKLKSITLPTNAAALTDLSQTFQSSPAIESIVLPVYLPALTTMANFANGCSGLKSITFPTANPSSLTNMSQSFISCYSLDNVVLPSSLPALTTMATAFQSCYNLENITMPTSAPQLSTITQTFNSCYKLKSVVLPQDASKINSLANTFNVCYNITDITLPTYLPLVNDMNSAFYYCSNLKTINNLPNIGSGVNSIDGGNAFYFTESIPDVSLNGKFGRLVFQGYGTNSVSKLKSLRLFNPLSPWNVGSSPYLGITYCGLDASALNDLFTDLSTNGAGTGSPRGIVISGNPGSFTVTRSATLTIGSSTGFISPATDISVGMEISGNGADSPVAVTFDGTLDTVNLTAHGLKNNAMVSFSSITTTTGIIVYTPYYVINKTDNDFQLSYTPGGSVIPLTNNGSGFLLYQNSVIAISSSTFTLDVPATLNGSNTLTFGIAKRSIATMKRWTVTG